MGDRFSTPLPRFPMLHMAWCDLLFAHWSVPSESLRALLPKTQPALELDLFWGKAWLGIVPFRMAGVRWGGLPSLPGAREFPELNVRTYVRAGGRPGVWFFSLDAASPLAVRGARLGFHLPYWDATMRCDLDGGEFVYQSERVHRGGGTAVFRARYAAKGPVFRSRPGTFEHWLTERYRLFAADARGRLWRGEIQHDPWPLQPARAVFDACEMTGGLGIRLPASPPHLLFAGRIDVKAGLLVAA